nr:MAG TPA: hypothetical protein [Bacteriophage sp.]
MDLESFLQLVSSRQLLQLNQLFLLFFDLFLHSCCLA